MSKQPSDKALEKSSKILAAICVSIALVSILGANLLKDYTVVLGGVAVVFVLVGAVFLRYGKEYGQYYTAKKSFKEDERGIVWVWIVAILTWAIMAVAYFALAGIVYMILDQVEAAPYAYPQAFLDNISLTRDVTGWFLIIMTVGILGWALISSVRKVDDTMPAY